MALSSHSWTSVTQRKHHGNFMAERLEGMPGGAGDGIQVTYGHPKLELIKECSGLGAGDPSSCGSRPRPWKQARLSRRHKHRGVANRRVRWENAGIPQPRAGEGCSQGQPTVLPAQADKDLEYLFPMHPPNSAERTYGSRSTNIWFFSNPFN